MRSNQLEAGRRLLSALIAAALVLAAAAAGAELRSSDETPAFGERSLYILHAPILFFGPADPADLSPGELTLSFEEAYANSFSETFHARAIHRDRGLKGQPFRQSEAEDLHRGFPDDAIAFVDGELLRTSLSGRIGLARSLSLGLEVVYNSHNAFTLDHAIESFHSTFGLKDVGRTYFPSGQFVVMLQQPGGAMAFDDRGPQSGLGDTTLTISYRAPGEAGPAKFGLDAAIKAPTGRARDYNGSGSWDAGVAAFVRRYGRKWNFGAEGGIVFPGSLKGPAALRTAPFARVSIEANRRFGGRTRMGCSFTIEQSPFRRERLSGVSRSGGEIGLGIERDLYRRWSTRFTVIENIPRLGDRADVGVVLRLTRR